MTEIKLRAPRVESFEYIGYARNAQRIGIAKIGWQWMCDTAGIGRIPTFHRTWHDAIAEANRAAREVLR